MSKILRPKELMNLIGVSRSTIWRWEQEGKLPPKIIISDRVGGWRSSDIEKWLEDHRSALTGHEIAGVTIQNNRRGND